MGDGVRRNGSDDTGGLSLFAVSPPGLEQIVAAEVGELGFGGVVVEGGVEWTGTVADVGRANLWLRTASRVLVRVGRFRARTFFELERHASRLGWAEFVGPGRAVTVRVTSRKSKLYHEAAIAERLFRALQDATGARPAAGTEEEDEEGATSQLFVVRVLRDAFTISADSSGALLHRRGYRQQTGKAPLRETLATALLRSIQWRGQWPLLDPFCGSGTIPIEATLIARDIAPGLAGRDRGERAFAFTTWPLHDGPAWAREITEARDRIRDRAVVPILGSDRSAGAVMAARANATRAGVEADIAWTVAPLSAAPGPGPAGVLVTNPPYGQRVSAGAELRDLYAALGRYVRENLPNGSIVLLSPDARLDAQIGFPLEIVADTRNGGIPVRLLKSAGW
jgi:23S rRNA G2445 N2-methylase RlmL